MEGRSSFSEEKEAKRLFPFGPERMLTLCPYGESFLVLSLKKEL
jgi:hypothetical protein